MRRVEYREKRQAALVRRSLERFASFWDENDAKRVLAVIEVLPYFAIDLASLKHPAFFEERETRLLHLVLRSGERYEDPGGHTAKGERTPPLPVRVRESQGASIPYIALPFSAPLLRGVVVGPKNPARLEEVQERVTALGYPRVLVRRSAAPYR